jgi:hypothetical protein
VVASTPQYFYKIMLIYLDFDGTVVEHQYPKMGRCNFGCMEIIKKLQDAGHKIVLNTYRADIGNGVDAALKYLNEQAWMCLRDKSINIEDFELSPITEVINPKIYPQQWDLENAIREDILFIDDIAPNIPLKPACMTKGNMVDWDELDKQFLRYGIYN